MSPYENGYGQLSQQWSQEQIIKQNAMNHSAQFFDKSNAMGHTELLGVQLREAQKARQLCNQMYGADHTPPLHQKALGDPWPWPVSVSKCATEHNAFLKRVADYDRRAKSEPKPEAQHFDTKAHRAFMRGLG